jgi:DNA-binding winged helix-turn-helix (wHTH) protein/tetratricopeptide (TPR) repeat protein
MQSSRDPDFFVADWRICPVLGRLERGEVAVSVEPRSMQVLSCLARHAPNVVSKQRLIHEVWGDGFVTDEVLSHAVWELRKAFGDEARNPRYIQTLARKGYRLLAPVTFGVAAEPLAPGCRIAHYEILEMLGGGAMGEVYKARDQRLGRVVALKFLPAELTRDPSARRRFTHEAQAVALLDHQNVATIYEVGETEGGRAYLTLAFYEGETLQRKLERGSLPLPEAVGIARQIARGLAAAHSRQIVHRDVKPANIVVLTDGTVKLLDFGLAKMVGATSLTRLGASPGTPAYKSPEQTRGEKVDPRSDLWALGVVLYEMVTGRQPFGGDYEQAMIYSILNETPRPLDDSCPPELTEVIERALKKDPAERYATAEELEENLAGIPLGEVAPRRARSRRRLAPRRKWLAGGVAALLLLGAVLGAWYWKAHRWDFSPEVQALMDQGDRQEGRGDTKRMLVIAESTYRKALARDPANPLIKAQLAAMLCRFDLQFPKPGRRQEIRRLTKEAVESAPGEAMPWVARAKFLLLDGKAKESTAAARKAVEYGPEIDRSHTALGEALFAQKLRDEGLEELRKAAEMPQGSVRARMAYAYYLQQATRQDAAAAELLKVLDLDPDHPTANYRLASVYLQSGRYRDALPLFQKAFEEARDYRSINGLGLVYLNLDRMSEAIEAFSEAYRLEADPITARNLAECYGKIGRDREARHWYETALGGFDRKLALGGLRDFMLYVRSFCAAKLGRYKEALGNIEEAMSLKPRQGDYLFRAAQIHAMAGHREEAYSYVRQAVQEGYPREDLGSEPLFHAFLDDPRFQTILESAAR